jgi:hypothetical protein
MRRRLSSHKERPLTLLNLATAGVMVTWLAFASWGVAYLISH